LRPRPEFFAEGDIVRKEAQCLQKNDRKSYSVFSGKNARLRFPRCEVFNVSGATIRADLRQLEEAGMLTRTHGGAVLRTRASFEQASDMREVVNLTAKERIGQRAAALVEDGDIIVLDTGTTTLHIARHIRDRQNVTVVTNDYQIARELEASPTIQIILLGDRQKATTAWCPSTDVLFSIRLMWIRPLWGPTRSPSSTAPVWPILCWRKRNAAWWNMPVR
jgi:DeoR family fructose operon transcriptional repressor